MKLTLLVPALYLSTACVTDQADTELDDLGAAAFDEDSLDEDSFAADSAGAGMEQMKGNRVCFDEAGNPQPGDCAGDPTIDPPRCTDASGNLVPCEPGLPICTLALRLEVTETLVPEENESSFLTKACKKFSGEQSYTSVGAGAFKRVVADGGFWDSTAFRLVWGGMCEQLAPAREDSFRRKSVKLVLDHTDCPPDVTAEVGVRGSAAISAAGIAEANYGEVWIGTGWAASGHSWGARSEGKVYARAFTKEAGAEGRAVVSSDCTVSDEVGLSGNVSAESGVGITISHGQVCQERVFDHSRINLSLRATSDDNITLHYPVPGGNVPQFVEVRSVGFEAQARSAMPAKGLWSTFGSVSKIDAFGELGTTDDTLTISPESCIAKSATAIAQCSLTTVGPNELRTR